MTHPEDGHTGEDPTGEQSPHDQRARRPVEQEAVRRLLRRARVDSPMPPDVARRLDSVLTELGAGSASDQQPATADVRRGRRGRVLLAAAAVLAVVVLGGLAGLVGLPGPSEQDTTASSGSGGPARQAAPEGGESGHRSGASDSGVVGTSGALPRLHRDTFHADVLALGSVATSGRPRSDAPNALNAPGRTAQAVRCLRPRLGPGDRARLVRLGGSPVVLVLRRPRDGVQRVEAYRCLRPGQDTAGRRGAPGTPRRLAVTSRPAG